jgi:hypothetical protein
MHPLGSPIIDLEAKLNRSLIDGHVIGFLIDSRTAALKRSGLITHSDCVMPLHYLLGSRATIFYPDPRLLDGDAYEIAIDNFSEALMRTSAIPCAIEELSLLMMTFASAANCLNPHRSDTFQDVAVLSLDRKTSCMWYQQVYEFIKDYMGRNSHAVEEVPWVKRKMIEHGGAISLEVIKSCAGLLISRFV